MMSEHASRAERCLRKAKASALRLKPGGMPLSLHGLRSCATRHRLSLSLLTQTPWMCPTSDIGPELPSGKLTKRNLAMSIGCKLMASWQPHSMEVLSLEV